MTDTSAAHDVGEQQLHARLAEAVDTVGELRQQLRALIAAEEKDHVSADTLHEAAAQMQAYIAQMQAVTETALAALPDLRSALKQAEAFLAATDLSQVVTDLAETRVMIRSILDDRIRTAEQGRDTAQQELEQIRDRAARLPERHRRSLGMD